MNENLKIEDFQPYLNTDFGVVSKSMGVTDLRLVEIEDLKQSHAQGFSLMFKSAKESVLPQKIRTVSHPDMGSLDIFLVPVSRGIENEIYYQAVFTGAAK